MARRMSIGLCIVLMLYCLGPQASVEAQGGTVRRVYAPIFSGDIRWAEAGIFWFGRVDPPGAPGQNYADVRVAYNNDGLAIYVNIEDYYIWYNKTATPASDLTQYDAVAIYLDTAHDRASTPQMDDYLFLSGLRLYEQEANYRRQARGTGTTWNFDWDSAWEDGTYASWYFNPGPNDSQWDYGWWSYIHIPWAALGRSGPPPQGTLWGLGVRLYDRDGDQLPAGAVQPEHWPETFHPDQPVTWGELAFGLATYTPQPSLARGTVVIRQGLGGSWVKDTWAGGGGTCSGGHEGDPENDTHGDSTALFVANQSLIADFPCFSKSFLRFPLDAIPPGKVILSATLTLHHWGNANPSGAQPSLIWLISVDEDWADSTLTWNNAPLAQENLTATWVNVLPAFPGWPGMRYDWDATQAVAQAYAAGRSLNIALYTADTHFHSSKYFTSSDTGDWNAVGRPTLTVVWGDALAVVSKAVRPVAPSEGQRVTYTLSLLGSGNSLTLTDDLPAQVSAPGPIQVSGGPAAGYDPGTHRLTWSGSPNAGQPVTITFPATVEVSGPRAVFNTAVLTDSEGLVSSDTATFIVDAHRLCLPLVLRNH